MTIQTRQVTVNLFDNDGSPINNARIVIKLIGLGNEPGGAVSPGEQVKHTDEYGVAVFTLWENKGTYSNTYYEVQSWHPSRGNQIHRREKFLVPDHDADLEDLIALALAGVDPNLALLAEMQALREETINASVQAVSSAEQAGEFAVSAGTAQSEAQNSANIAALNRVAAETSATNAANSETAAANSSTSAGNSATAAAGSATTATNAASIATGAASTATTKATEASTSAAAALSAANNSESYAGNAENYAAQAFDSATNAQNSALSASGSAAAAGNSASNANTSALNANNSAIAAAASEAGAAAAALSATNAASNAGTSADQAALSATSASNSASTATAAATSASNSADAAENSASSASNSADQAEASATSAQESATQASASKTAAQSAASTATTKASEASTSATNAANSATLAQKWANENEDVEVAGGEYSAKHYAAKAEEHANNPNRQFVGEIRMGAFSLIPDGWLACDGSAVSRSTYSTLFSVIGTAYGAGNGSTTFNLPDMRGRNPIGVNGATNVLASSGGADSVTLGINNLPAHSHGLVVYDNDFSEASETPDSTYKYLSSDTAAGSRVWGSTVNSPFTTDLSNTSSIGSGDAVVTRDKYLTVNFIIATIGVIPA